MVIKIHYYFPWLFTLQCYIPLAFYSYGYLKDISLRHLLYFKKVCNFLTWNIFQLIHIKSSLVWNLHFGSSRINWQDIPQATILPMQLWHLRKFLLSAQFHPTSKNLLMCQQLLEKMLVLLTLKSIHQNKSVKLKRLVFWQGKFWILQQRSWRSV